MSPEAFHAAALPYIRQAVQNPALSTEEIAGLLQARASVSPTSQRSWTFLTPCPTTTRGCSPTRSPRPIRRCPGGCWRPSLPALEGLADWTVDGIHDALIGLAESLEVKNATLMWPVRIAAAGKAVTPGGAVEICHILGKDECLRRLRLGLDKLGG